MGPLWLDARVVKRIDRQSQWQHVHGQEGDARKRVLENGNELG